MESIDIHIEIHHMETESSANCQCLFFFFFSLSFSLSCLFLCHVSKLDVFFPHFEIIHHGDTIAKFSMKKVSGLICLVDNLFNELLMWLN